MNDWQYLDSYVRDGSESAFQALVERHGGMVYASALRQVREAQLAEDVAQAVFILLARKARGLRHGTILSGWLFQTTRFVAARALRSQQRRARREQEALDMQHLTSADEAWHRMAPVLDEALAALGPTDRHAILLRYFEGHSVREVGTCLGVAEEAAKKRIARAVDRLRETLGHKGTTLSAVAILSALAGNATATASEALISSWSASALAGAGESSAAAALVQEVLKAWHWARVKWMAALGTSAAAAAVVLLTSQGGSGPGPAQNPGSAGNGDGAPLAPIASAAGETAPASPAELDLKRLSLQVVSTGSGDAVPHARVVLRVWRPQEIEPVRELMTSPAGVCEMTFAADAGRIDVGVMQDGWSARYVTWPSEGSADIPAQYRLALAPVTNTIGGTIADPSGRPLANAVIWFEGHESGDSSHRERPRERFGFADAVPVARTDASGHWLAALIPPAHRGFQLEARHPDFADTVMIKSPAQASLDELTSPELRQLWSGQLQSTMQDAMTLIGAVVDEQGRPIAGAKVQEQSQSEVFPADAQGQFCVPKLKSGSWSYTVTAEGFAPLRTNALITPGMQPVVVTLSTGAVLRLRVMDETGSPVPDAEVGLEQWGGNRHDFDWRARTDAEGRVEWASAPAGVTLELFARKDGYCYTRGIRVQADGIERPVELQHTLEVFGRVLDDKGGWGVSDFRATPGYGASDRFFDGGQQWFGAETVRGTNGLFRLVFIENVRPWRIRITADGYEDWTSGPLTNALQVALEIQLHPVQAADAVRGTVLLPDGTPAADAQVALLSFEHNVTLRNQSFQGNPRWMTKTDERGAFTFPVNRLAHSVAAVGKAGYTHQRVRDSREPVTLQLEAWGRVEGVVDEDAAAFGVANVRLYDPTTDNYQGRVSLLNSYAAELNADREFALEQVPPGEFCLFVNSLQNIPFHHRTPLVVRPGATTRVVIQDHAGTRVTGRFVAAEGRTIDWTKDLVVAHFYADSPPLASAFLAQVPPEEHAMRALEFWTSPAGRAETNIRGVCAACVRHDGSFVSVENLPPGTYLFFAAFQGGSASRQITIGEDPPPAMSLGEVPLQ